VVAPPNYDCPVENHDAHDVPRLFVTREPGRLWLFDICNPHVWPGSHWGVPDEIGRSEAGSVISQDLTGDARSVAATGKTMHELRATLAAHLATALSAGDIAAQVSVEVLRPQRREDETWVPQDDWEPPIPPGIDITDQGDRLLLRVESFDALEHLVAVLTVLQNISIVIEGAGSIEFCSEPERFYILHDSPSIGFAIDDAARLLHVEVVSNTEPLSVHWPTLASWAATQSE
jgi:hypothetical protein